MYLTQYLDIALLPGTLSNKSVVLDHGLLRPRTIEMEYRPHKCLALQEELSRSWFVGYGGDSNTPK